ncbi:MAG: sulfurtransferase TusA family protein [Candidatus Dormibacteria bacterium]
MNGSRYGVLVGYVASDADGHVGRADTSGGPSSRIEVKVGEVMAVLSTDSGTKKDLPAWAAKMGHEFLGAVDEQGYFKCFVRRMK